MFSSNADAKQEDLADTTITMMTSQNKTPMIKRRLTSTPAARRQRGHDEWKASLRKACFDRARKNRKDVIWKKRQQQPRTAAEDGDLRDVVEQELRHQGVAIVTPGFCEKDNNQFVLPSSSPTGVFHTPLPPTTPHCCPQHSQQEQLLSDKKLFDESNDSVYDNTENFISEEELYELLQEVEEDIRRSEEELLEEVLEQERYDELEREEEIAHYQEWEEQLPDNLPEEECVICPICCEGMLRQSPAGDIICPSEACQFLLQQQTRPHDNLSLADLKERLRLALENHSVRCHGSLIFELQPLDGIMWHSQESSLSLVGTCQNCEAIASIT